MNNFVRICAALLLSFYLQAGYAQSQAPKLGLQTYTPTRIEWLTVMLNSLFRKDLSTDSLFTLHFASQGADTLVVKVSFHPDTNRQLVNLTTQMAREGAERTIKSYGWDSWARVIEQVEVLRVPPVTTR